MAIFLVEWGVAGGKEGVGFVLRRSKLGWVVVCRSNGDFEAVRLVQLFDRGVIKTIGGEITWVEGNFFDRGCACLRFI